VSLGVDSVVCCVDSSCRYEEKERKRLQRESWRNREVRSISFPLLSSRQETEEEKEAREKERKGRFFFANEDLEKDRMKKIYDEARALKEEDDLANDIPTFSEMNLKRPPAEEEDSDESDEGSLKGVEMVFVIRCDICRWVTIPLSSAHS
jgi:hypothetical protein